MAGESPEKSNLKPTASFVGGREGILTRFWTPEFIRRGLPKLINDAIKGILSGELSPDDSQVIEVATEIRRLKSDASIAVERSGDTNGDKERLKKSLAVIDNYSHRLLTTIRDSAKYRKDAPAESDIA